MTESKHMANAEKPIARDAKQQSLYVYVPCLLRTGKSPAMTVNCDGLESTTKHKKL